MYVFVPLAAVYFFIRKYANLHLKSKNSREKYTFESAIMHLKLRSPMFEEYCTCFFLCVNVGRNDQIAGGFPSQVDFREASRFMFEFNMLQKASKWRSPNPFNYTLK